jgi:hypothetical protein
MNEAQLIKAIKARIEKGDQSKDKAEQHYASAGILLNELRDGRSKAEWAELLKTKCDLSVTRAYELIAIADGRKTVAEVRLANAKRVQKHAEKRRSRPLANGQNLPAKVELGEVEDDDEYVDSRLKKPLPDCPVCKGEGTFMVNIYGPCGTKESSTCIPCPCTQWKRRGNPTLYDDLRKWGEEAIVREKRGGTACDAPSAAAAEPQAIAPTVTPAKSWKVEVIAKDGKRYGNGVRLRTEEEADAYRFNAVLEMERKDQFIVVIATEVISCADPGGFHQIRRRKNGKLTHTLEFVHGACGTLEWEEIGAPAKVQLKPKVQQGPIPIIDDGTDDAGPSDGPQQFWERSLAKVAGVAISLEEFWTRQHGAAWRDFPVSRDLATLAREAADAWNSLAEQLDARVVPVTAPATDTDDYPDLPASLNRAQWGAAA